MKNEEKRTIDFRKTVVFHHVFNDDIDLRNIRFKIVSFNMMDFYWTDYLNKTDLSTTQLTLYEKRLKNFIKKNWF